MEAVTESTTTVLVLVSRKLGMSFAEFRAYYEERHVPLIHARLMHGDLRPLSYTRYYTEHCTDESEDSARLVAARFPFGGAENWSYDCVATLTFRDTQHRDAMFSEFVSHREEIDADNARFLDVNSITFIYPGASPSSVIAKADIA